MRDNAANYDVVYTKEFVDPVIQQVKDLEAKIDILRRDVKTLSDANDGFTKRIDDMESRFRKSKNRTLLRYPLASPRTLLDETAFLHVTPPWYIGCAQVAVSAGLFLALPG